MAGQKSISQAFRKPNLMTGAGWRAFMAPYNVELGNATFEQTGGPKILDMMYHGPITDSALPDGWRGSARPS